MHVLTDSSTSFITQSLQYRETSTFIITMQFSTVFFTIASALLFIAPAVSAIACDPCTLQASLLPYVEILMLSNIVSACNDKNHYPPGHSCKYTLDQCDQNGPIFSGCKSLAVVYHFIRDAHIKSWSFPRVRSLRGVAGAVVGMAEVSPVSFFPPHNVRARCSLRIRQVWYTGPISWLAGSETQGADLGFEVSHRKPSSQHDQMYLLTFSSFLVALYSSLLRLQLSHILHLGGSRSVSRGGNVSSD